MVFDEELYRKRVEELVAEGRDRRDAMLQASLEQEPDGDLIYELPPSD